MSLQEAEKYRKSKKYIACIEEAVKILKATSENSGAKFEIRKTIEELISEQKYGMSVLLAGYSIRFMKDDSDLRHVLRKPFEGNNINDYLNAAKGYCYSLTISKDNTLKNNLRTCVQKIFDSGITKDDFVSLANVCHTALQYFPDEEDFKCNAEKSEIKITSTFKSSYTKDLIVTKSTSSGTEEKMSNCSHKGQILAYSWQKSAIPCNSCGKYYSVSWS